ncbi:hypothetical protein [Streptomyces sp. NBC_00829]|uniref:hypothetical protein n=1 Tax=Streptomyces sp. NBC_00829 TaxID=2903679 RepID=UPI00386FD55A|nr:hypothetical protein OG293_23390 [Streptomyces sp. NBC_00829]
MSAPVSRDPLVVNTRDGSCWVRRAVTREGRGLYALEGAPACCPEYVLASLRELAEIGLRGMADALPMPVGTPRCVEDELAGVSLSLFEEEQVSARLRLAVKSAQRGRRVLRARVAELEAASGDGSTRTVDEDPIVFALTEEAAALPGFCRNVSPYGRRCDQPSEHDGDHAMADGAGGHFGWPATDVVRPEALHASSGAVIEIPAAPVDGPNGCGRCGIAERRHGIQYGDGGGHAFERPTQEQIKERMLRRRSVTELRGLLAGPREDTGYVSPLHRDYATPHDLPSPEVQS